VRRQRRRPILAYSLADIFWPPRSITVAAFAIWLISRVIDIDAESPACEGCGGREQASGASDVRVPIRLLSSERQVTRPLRLLRCSARRPLDRFGDLRVFLGFREPSSRVLDSLAHVARRRLLSESRPSSPPFTVVGNLRIFRVPPARSALAGVNRFPRHRPRPDTGEAFRDRFVRPVARPQRCASSIIRAGAKCYTRCVRSCVIVEARSAP
jgi:hypothetical protein